MTMSPGCTWTPRAKLPVMISPIAGAGSTEEILIFPINHPGFGFGRTRLRLWAFHLIDTLWASNIVYGQSAKGEKPICDARKLRSNSRAESQRSSRLKRSRRLSQHQSSRPRPRPNSWRLAQDCSDAGTTALPNCGRTQRHLCLA
jgi:hypothetical protein